MTGTTLYGFNNKSAKDDEIFEDYTTNKFTGHEYTVITLLGSRYPGPWKDNAGDLVCTTVVYEGHVKEPSVRGENKPFCVVGNLAPRGAFTAQEQHKLFVNICEKRLLPDAEELYSILEEEHSKHLNRYRMRSPADWEFRNVDYANIDYSFHK